MNKPATHTKSMRDCLRAGAGRFLWDAKARVTLSDLRSGSGFGGRLPELSGRSVLLAPQAQLATAVAMIELDGVARQMIICPPDLSAEHLREVIGRAGVEAIVSEHDRSDTCSPDVALHVPVSSVITPAERVELDRHDTEWVLLTSGTTGRPKMLAHTLASLTAAIKSGQHQGTDVVWGTFYDIRRYGGLQIFLRAVLGRGSFVLSDAHESPTAHLLRLGTHAVTHLTGTPSHWRRALMSPSAHAIRPRYVRLSGEIADQAILNTLRAFYPQAAVGHAFASTEAGVGFEVNDGLEGFPASIVGAPGEVEIEVDDSSLWIRSPRTAVRYVGEESAPLMDARGFVDTGDIVERRGDRYYFLGRRSGVINVGGLKVYPEEVETVLNRHPAVRMACVRARRSPITGALVVADVVLHRNADAAHERVVERGDARLKDEILKLCRDTLPRHKVPVALNSVPVLAVNTTGKIARKYA
jgi:acyl-CoA synthetase (AMP-forming)/AMP-acid ligase II